MNGLFRNLKLFTLALLCLQTPSVALSQTDANVDSIAFEIALASTGDIAETLQLLETAIAETAASPSPDLRAYFDLNDLLLDTLVEAGRIEEAAQLSSNMAQFALENAEQLNRNPISYARRAAKLFEQAENYRQALNNLEFELNYRLESGQIGTEVAQAYKEMERLSVLRGDTAGASRYRSLAEQDVSAERGGVRSSGEGGFSEVEVFYATDRARSGSTDPDEFYGYGRGELEYGIVNVSIPDTHTPGAIELPSIWRLEFGAKPSKHVMVRAVTPMENSEYFSTMRERVRQSPRKEAFVFVHGFNTKFDAAARRAAQLAYDMNYSGIPVLYSWPSAGKTFRYVADTAVVRLSGRRLAQFLQELHENSGAETINIVAHSMGNRALTDALELLSLKTGAGDQKEPMFGQLFFAAPDVDADLFSEMMKTIRPIANRMTLYASEVDWALAASRKLHGNAPRAGQGGEDILAASAFDSVDMSDLGEDMLAHTYFANDSSAITDIASLLWTNADPNQRCGLVEAFNEQGISIWHYEKGVCQDSTLVGLISQLWNRQDVDAEIVQETVRSLVPNAEQASRLELDLINMLDTDQQ